MKDKDVVSISKEEFMDLCSKVICDTLKDFKEKTGSSSGEEIIVMLVGTLMGANLRKELFKEGE